VRLLSATSGFSVSDLAESCLDSALCIGRKSHEMVALGHGLVLQVETIALVHTLNPCMHYHAFGSQPVSLSSVSCRFDHILHTALGGCHANPTSVRRSKLNGHEVMKRN
jgi:hypothetical protein